MLEFAIYVWTIPVQIVQLHCNFGGALGIVFGDIGTSPITIQTAFNPNDPLPVPISTDNVYGLVSLIFWSVRSSSR